MFLELSGISYFCRMIKIGKEQIKELKECIGEMSESTESFILMIYKKKDGKDNIIQYGYNFPEEKLVYYLQEAIKSRIKEDI